MKVKERSERRENIQRNIESKEKKEVKYLLFAS